MPSSKALDQDWAKLQGTFSHYDPRKRGLLSPERYVVTVSVLGDLKDRRASNSNDHDPLAYLGNIISPTDKTAFSNYFGLLEVKEPVVQTWYFANVSSTTLQASLKANLECIDPGPAHPMPPPLNCRGVVQDEALGLRYEVSLPRAKVSELLTDCEKIRWLIEEWLTTGPKK